MNLAKHLFRLAVITCIVCWPVVSMAAANLPTIGGGVVFTYQYKPDDNSSNRRGGDYGLDYFIINAKGKVQTNKKGDNITYAAEYRLLTDDKRWLHYGWAAYNFWSENTVQGGYFQVPFGNLPYGYDSFYAPLNFYVGLTDNQALGFGYKLEKGPWRFDLDFYKNDSAGQNQTYGTNTTPDQPFQAENTGNIRLAYTFNKGEPKNVTVSVSGKGGQVFANNNELPSGGYPKTDAEGTRWAAAINMDANWGPWNLKLGATSYAYSVPRSGDVTSIDRGTILAQDYGYELRFPARGQLFNASLKRQFKVDWGPLSSISPYVDWSYLHIPSSVDYVNTSGKQVGDEHFIQPGVEWVAGPIYIWTEWLIGKNTGGTAFVGEDDGSWHNELYIATAFYF